jgi:hypothetical protein
MQGPTNYVIREIYSEALAKIKQLRSRLSTELEQLNFLLENELVSSNGEPLSELDHIEVINNINADIKDTKADIEVVDSQINFFETYLSVPLH